MILTKSSKELIDKEYEKIKLIADYLKKKGEYDKLCIIPITLTIYNKISKDIHIIEKEEDEFT